MKRFTLILMVCFTCCLSLLSTKAKADHAAGGELIYEWISDSTYRFFFKFYRDCGGIATYPTHQLCGKNLCSTATVSETLQMWPGQIPPGVDNGTAVTLGCSGSTTECDDASSPVPGIEEYWYYAIVTMPHKCDYWTFSVAVSARNTSNNVNGGLLFVETTFNNQYAEGNSSPYFDNKPIPYTCKDLPYSFNNQAIDPNGDSLWTELVLPMTGNCGGTGSFVGWKGTWTPALGLPNNPFQTATVAAPLGSFNLVGATGQMNFTATDVGPQTFAVKVSEYRNGVLIGSIIRDVQVQVLDPSLCNYTPSTINPAATITGGAHNPATGQIQACVNQQITFCYDVATTDPIGRLIVADNSKTSAFLTGMNVVYTGQKTKTVRGCVTWTPNSSQTGLRNLIVNVKDSTCRPPGIVFQQSFTIPIFVNGKVKGFKDTSICPGDKVQLSATGGGSYVWTEVTGGTSTLSCSNCNAPIVTPFATMDYVVESKATNFCVENKDTLKVTMLPVPKHTDVTEITTCPGNSVNYDLKVIKDPGVTYTVQWTPATYLSSTTSETPVSQPLNDIEYYITIGASNNRCKAFDTAKITLLDGFKIETPDMAICAGQDVDIKATGDAAYTYSWSTFPPSAATFTDPTVLNPKATPTSGLKGNIKFELRASRAGCDDSVASFNLDVQPVPTVVVNDDQMICYGDTMTLNGIVTPEDYDKYTFQWSPSSALTKPNSKRPLFSAFQDATLVLTATTPAGCTGKDELIVDVLPSDFLVLSGDTAICPGQEAHIHLTGIDVDSFWWAENSHFMNDRFSMNPIIKPAASHTYTVFALDKNGCRDTQKVNVEVKPGAVVFLPDTLKLYPGEALKINPSGNALHYSWFPPVGLNRADIADPIASPKVNTRYFVTARTEAGCQTTDSVNVLVMKDTYMDIPNAFAPGRGPNGVFKVINLGNAKLTKFTVFNRWGVKMFETKDISQGWDGSYNGQAQPMGVYMYTIEAETPGGSKVNKQGNVTMIR